MRWIFISKNFSNKVCSSNKKTLNSYNFYIWVEMIFLLKYTSACNILIIIDLSTKMKGKGFSVYDLMIIFSFLWSKKGGREERYHDSPNIQFLQSTDFFKNDSSSICDPLIFSRGINYPKIPKFLIPPPINHHRYSKYIISTSIDEFLIYVRSINNPRSINYKDYLNIPKLLHSSTNS